MKNNTFVNNELKVFSSSYASQRKVKFTSETPGGKLGVGDLSELKEF